MSDELELRTAWAQAVGTGAAPDGEFESLVARHRESHRRYHGVRHVVWVVRHVHELAVEVPLDDLDAIVVAACYHDAIYDPRRSDNEAASAALAERVLAELEWGAAERRAAVAAMIRATAGHVADESPPAGRQVGAPSDTGTDADVAVLGADVAGPDRDTDTDVLLDADLAVLGSDATAYQAYATGVRAEYAHVPDAAWAIGRGAVLRGFLQRPAIYRTAPARARWESRARANITAELAGLH